MPTRPRKVPQCQKPSGLPGRFTLWRMNMSHSKLTDWGLAHISVQQQFTILDVGCGGGRTIGKLAALATQGKVYGVDYSEDSVSVSRKINTAFIAEGRVEIQQATVSRLPFADNKFDLVTAVETHFYWPNLADDLREVFRVTRPGGQLAIIAEVYKGAPALVSRLVEKSAPQTGIRVLTPDEHGDLLAAAGNTDIKLETQPAKGWITVTGKKTSETALCRTGLSPGKSLVSAESSPEANPFEVCQSVWYRLVLLFMAANAALCWFIAGPSNPWCALAVAWATCALVPAVPISLVRRVPRQWFFVPPGERTLHHILGVGIFGWLLDVSGWNRRVVEPLRGFSGGKGGLVWFEQSVRSSAVSHGICFAIHALLAVLALFSMHPWQGALLMLLPGVVLHLYPVLLQRSLMLRLQPLLDKFGSC
ncbi:MAG: methyltransferase domain-containing protein [Acidobacteriota bacterium]|nr:methyltransferase domain-containing protein [Acidobacteriota bacterium]